jgi:photosystem II stability/assembly factor-like uncharacterized protein
MNKSKRILIIILLFVSSKSYSQWEQSMGTDNLDVQSLLSTTDYLFFGGATGAYRSGDDAYSFAYSNNGNDDVGPTRGFAQDENYIYTCTSQGVFRSSDMGVSWIPKSEGLTQSLSHGIIATNGRLFLASLSGVFKSIDQGETWISAGMIGIDTRSITCLQDSILFVGTQGEGIFKSEDEGNSWQQVNNGLTSQNFRAIQAQGNAVFAGGQNGTGVYRSTDFGNNWTLMSNGIASSSYRGFASNEDYIFAGSTSQGVFFSPDLGDNWIQLNEGLGDLNVFDLELNDNYIIAGTHSDGVYRFPIEELPNINVSISEINQTNTRKLIKIVDLFGRECKENSNTILFYVYNNGEVEKQIVIK